MIQGTDKYLRKLKRASESLRKEVGRVLFNLAKQLVDKAQETHDTGINTTRQDNAYVCAVYYNGKLMYDPYIPTGSNTPGIDITTGYAYPNLGHEGHQWAYDWAVSGFQASGRGKGKGYEVMIANCAWYTKPLEEGMYRKDGRGRQWLVIRQVFDEVYPKIFERAAVIVKNYTGMDLRKCAYQISEI